MSRSPIPTHAFALVIAQHDGRFLLVQERDGSWYLPAGRVEPGESIPDAAVREALEESGVRVVLTGLLRVEHSPGTPMRAGRLRVFFAARPLADPTPRTEPTGDSLGARWVRLEDLAALPLRGDEVEEVLGAVHRGAPAYPLTLLVPGGAHWEG